jgi:predicted SprT family Zn-dependent metalloprotease
MTDPTPTVQQFSTYDALYGYFNVTLFGGELPPCILNFSRKSKRNHGFFAPERWEGKEGIRHEISLNPSTLKQRSARDVCSTLVHEMVHLWQAEFGKPSKGHHNRQWGAKMKDVGLHPSNTGAPGGKETGQQMTHYIVEGGPFDVAFQNLPTEFLPYACCPEPTKVTKARNKVKYTCVCCGANVWGKPEMRIQCMDCDSMYEPQEEG